MQSQLHIIEEVYITIYKRMLSESQRLEEEINSLQAKLKAYPEGHFYCTRDGNHYKWYHSNGAKQTYITKSNRYFAQQLVEKKYLSLKLKELIHEKRAIEFYLRHHSTESAEQYFAEHPEHQKLLTPFLQTQSEELSNWVQSPYETNLKYPEQRIHKTISGNSVRSKSEALIDMALYMKGIPFRYECALSLGETTIYPDFTVRHPITGNIYYWEHFGQMDKPKYAQNSISKLQLYTSHGILPGIHLITTYETASNPLTTATIERIISDFFS